NANSPADASKHENHSNPIGESLCTIGPAKCRIANIRPLTYTSSQIPRIPTVLVSARSTHWPGASSDAAVRNIEQNSTRNIGFDSSRNIEPAEYPDDTRSVGGNFTPVHSTITSAAGAITAASFTCHDCPIAPIQIPNSPPAINPPGHHACSVFRRAVF